MVAVAAFLIILVILFGLENVRNFFFGTLGVFAWIIVGILALAAIIVAVDWIEKEIKNDIADAKKEKEQRKKQKQAMADLKKNDPATYRKLTAGKRTALWAYGIGIGVTLLFCAFVLIMYLINK